MDSDYRAVCAGPSHHRKFFCVAWILARVYRASLGERYYSTGRILHSEPATKEDWNASFKFGAPY